jgi:hypothetical protein
VLYQLSYVGAKSSLPGPPEDLKSA